MSKPLILPNSDWASVTLESNIQDDYIIGVMSGGTPSTTNEDYWHGDIPWLTPKEITKNDTNIFVSKTERNITESGLNASAAKLLPSNTVALTKRAPVGSVAINATPMATNQGFLNFQCGEKLRPLFLAYWFKLNKQYLQQIANGSTYRELYLTDLFEFNLSIPTLDEQDAILSVINALNYITLLGIPIEQSVICPNEMLRVQNQSERLRLLSTGIALHLYSGTFSARDVLNNFDQHTND